MFNLQESAEIEELAREQSRVIEPATRPAPVSISRVELSFPEPAIEISINEIAYRSFELITAWALLIALSPLMAAVSLKLLLDRSGPILFRQTRVGYIGSTFQILKFRTMIPDAERNGKFICTTYDDPRITHFGRFLRRTKLDELPQLWNIIRGEMSFVGPRPEQPEFHKQFSSIPNWERRLQVKPGVTGLAQLSRKIGHKPEEKIIADLQYIENRSLKLDLRLMYLSLWTIFGKSPLK